MKVPTCLMTITGALGLGGGIAAANRLALDALLKAGYRVDVIALSESVDTVPPATENLSYRAAGNNKLRFTVMCWRQLLSQRYNVVLCDHVNLALTLAPLAVLRICRYQVQLHGVELDLANLNWEGRIGLFAAAYRTAVSEHTRETVLKLFPRLKITTCELSLDAAYSQPVIPLTNELRFTAIDGTEQLLDTQVILHVGRMSNVEQYKGQDVMIQAMPQILAEYPRAQLVLVGHGNDAERLRILATSYPLEVQHAIFMTGFVSDEILQQLYSQCYLFALPSRGEGFGLVYLEAMRYSRPCIGSRIDSARCIIQDGITGFLINVPTDSTEIAHRVLQLLRDPALATEMGRAGNARLIHRYLFSHYQARFIDYISSIQSS